MKNNQYNTGDEAGCCEAALDCGALPDACTNDIREEKLLKRQDRGRGNINRNGQQPNQGQGQIGKSRNWMKHFILRERNLLISCLVLVIALNMTTGQYLLYPFKIFSTWVHEMCHGLAGILMGGSISKLLIFKDGSGLAYTSLPVTDSYDFKRGFVASVGYPGTAVTGCLLLLFRRTTLGPTIGTIGIGFCLLLSCAIWVRNTWGLVILLSEGVIFCLLGWKLPAAWLDHLYNFLACTCCLNAVESIQDLFAVGNYYVGGELVSSSDAHTVAEKWGMDYRFWAINWLCLSAVLTLVGIVFAFDAKQTTWFKNKGTGGDGGAGGEGDCYYNGHNDDPNNLPLATVTTVLPDPSVPYGADTQNQNRSYQPSHNPAYDRRHPQPGAQTVLY